MTSLPTQRSLFCECNAAPCQCWPKSVAPRLLEPNQPASLRSSSPFATRRLHPDQGRQYSPSYNPSESQWSPAIRSCTPPADYVYGAHYPSPGSSSFKPPHSTQPQLHALLKARAILRMPESPAALGLQWDVRDAPSTAVIASNHEPENLYEHPLSNAYATSPPVLTMLVTWNDVLPRLVPIHARHGLAGVTIRDVLQAIHDILHFPVEQSMLWHLPSGLHAQLYNAHQERIARNRRDRREILTVDWLGDKSLFVCLSQNEVPAKRWGVNQEIWPHVYALKLRKGTLTSDV